MLKQMETVIKQAEENRNRSIGIANRVHEEYLPLKHEIDHMRREYLGLNPLPDLHEEEGSVISAEYVFASVLMNLFGISRGCSTNCIIFHLILAVSSQHTIDHQRARVAHRIIMPIL